MRVAQVCKKIYITETNEMARACDEKRRSAHGGESVEDEYIK